jgi:hypothetical protein
LAYYEFTGCEKTIFADDGSGAPTELQGVKWLLERGRKQFFLKAARQQEAADREHTSHSSQRMA